VFPEDIHPL